MQKINSAALGGLLSTRGPRPGTVIRPPPTHTHIHPGISGSVWGFGSSKLVGHRGFIVEGCALGI